MTALQIYQNIEFGSYVLMLIALAYCMVTHAKNALRELEKDNNADLKKENGSTMVSMHKPRW